VPTISEATATLTSVEMKRGSIRAHSPDPPAPDSSAGES
jgi:hypothetical protein